MILTRNCEFGTPMPLLFEDLYDQGCEVEAIEFLVACPIEWRLIYSDGRATRWRPGDRDGMPAAMRTFWDLQERRDGLTCGADAYCCTLETLGIGSAKVLLWPREGRCKPKRAVLEVLR